MQNTFFWAQDVQAAADYCKSAFAQDTENAIARADEICDNTFLFKDHWEMERTQVPVHFENEIDWAHIPADDIEWVFALNRHTIFLNLGKAWRFTGDEKYVVNFVRLVQDWIARVPHTPQTAKGPWRSLEAGLRCETWLRAMRLFENSPLFTRQIKQQMEQCLLQHGEYLMDTHWYFHRLSNWGVLQDHGLFLLGVYFGNNEWQQLALERLTDNLHLQVMRDGTHWEQSPMYHCEVLHCAIDALHIAHQNKIAVPAVYEQQVHNMCTALAKWVTPAGRLICQSDSDDTDARDLIAMGALVFNDPALKGVAGNRLFAENIWDFGTQALQNYDTISASNALLQSVALPDSGNYMLRQDASQDAAWLHMHCGCLGSGHGHADLLHIDLVHKGENVLIDSGRYTYVNTPLRRLLKHPAAHNTVRVDGINFSECVDSWAYQTLAQPVKGEYNFMQEADYLSGAHLGYIAQGVFVRRKVLYIKPHAFVIFDELHTGGEHTYEQFFHFGKGDITLQKNTAVWQGKNTNATVQCLVCDSAVLEKAPYSTDYNALSEGYVLHTKYSASGLTTLITIIGLDGKLDAELVPVTSARYEREVQKEKAQAVRITHNGQEYTVISSCGESISEVDLLCANGCQGYGQMLLFTPQNKKGVCAAW